MAPTFARDLVTSSVSSTATVNVDGSVDISIDTLSSRYYYDNPLFADESYIFRTAGLPQLPPALF